MYQLTSKKLLIFLIFNFSWKKAESDKFFLKVIKILNWAKINSQFMIRKAWYSAAQSSKVNAMVSNLEETASNSPSSQKKPKFTITFASKFRELDFIYHIGGYDAKHLQTQLVDYLEIFFRQGSCKSESSEDIGNTPLSLQELIETRSINSENLLGLGKSIVKSNLSFKKEDYNPEEFWFKKMIEDFIQAYTNYLGFIGLTRSNITIKSTDCSQYGGAFATNSKTLIYTPSIFMEKVFSSRVILVQVGFYEYFASVNVITFDYCTPNELSISGSMSDFEQECKKMKDLTHIVSCMLIYL